MELTSDVAEAVTIALSRGRSRLAVSGPRSLAVGVHGSHVLVGPLVARDGLGGCADCALAWWSDVSPHTAGGPPVDTGLDWAPVVRAMVARVLADPPGLWRRAVLVLDRDSGQLTLHRFLVHPACVACANPAKPPEPLDLRTPQPAVAGPLRTRGFDRETLREHLLDPRFGPVAHVARDEESPLALVTAQTAVPGRSRRESGTGRAPTFAASEVPAILEGLERALGGYRRPAVPVVVASWREVAHLAVDPRALGEHEPSLLARGTGYEQFETSSATSWVWARSTLHDRAVLVPEHVAYWHERGVGSRFVAESSNGCAVGGSREEAVLHGLLEVIERDAFLLAWYARARLVEVQPADDGELAAQRDVLAARGLHLRVLDLTSDFQVPVALAVVTADEETVRSGQAPALSLASSAAADPLTAIQEAVEACVTKAVMHTTWVRRRESLPVEQCRPLLEDFDLVQTHEDHTGLHGLWESRGLWEFLEHPAGTITEAELCARPRLATGDVALALRQLLERTHMLGMDVVVVDQSAPELVDALGLHAVKVLVPGTVPLTFGHRHRRTVGIPRLARAASILEGAVPWDDDPRPNPVPHPFP
ncbi:YcaO-like family protein [Cellulomonas persica]|uniref:SagD family biosynthesis docking scaffold protein n=1 Tax=Cellulomonas persica TaxID=76861 RepID=A0A510UVW1_9CELL|nr:YcaO-like family protein [Cellulomonas persica]GEK17631.1 SagD family biosynthesis docking scaffold protein [Cellulomonas persica]